MAVQFFFANPQRDMGEVLSSGLKAGEEFRQAQIKKDLDSTYNQHVVTEPQYDAAGNVIARPGDLNASGFIKSAQEAGLPMEESMKYLAHQKALRDAQLDTATTESMVRAAGYNPSPAVTGRAGAPIGNPAVNQEQAYLKTADKTDKSSLEDWFASIQKPESAQSPVAPTAEETAANDRLVDNLRNPSEVGPKTPAQGGVSYADVAKTLGIGGAPKVSADGTQMDLGSGVIQGQWPVEKPVEEAKMSAPEPWNTYVPQPLQKDTRTAGQAVQDTYQEDSGIGAGSTGVKPIDIFDYAKVTNVGDVKIKQGIDSALAKLGQSQDQAGVDNLMAIAAASVPKPALTGKTPEAFAKYIEAKQGYAAKVLEAQKKVAADLAAGNSGAIAEQMGREQLGLSKKQFALTVRQNDRAESQVSHPAIKGFLPSNAEKVALTDASGAVREIQDQMNHVPSPNSGEWNTFKMILAKSVVKAMSLPVGEGLLEEVAGKIQNGGSGVEAVDAFKNHGMSAGAANAAAQILETTLGINTIDGANRLAKGASDFARKKWSSYGEGSDFDKYFPEYKAGKGAPAGPATPPKKDRTTAKLGSITNPYPAGSTPPVGSYYIHPKTGKVMKRAR